MKNSIVKEKEANALNEVIEKVENFVRTHAEYQPTPKEIDNSTDLEKIHTIMYLDAINDLIKATSFIRSLRDVSEEEFEKGVTDDGKITVEDAKNRYMLHAMADIVSRMKED